MYHLLQLLEFVLPAQLLSHFGGGSFFFFQLTHYESLKQYTGTQGGEKKVLVDSKLEIRDVSLFERVS